MSDWSADFDQADDDLEAPEDWLAAEAARMQAREAVRRYGNGRGPGA